MRTPRRRAVSSRPLIGSAPQAFDWAVNGADAGRVNGVAFVGFENLQGRGDTSDSFAFTNGGSLRGTVDGGSGPDTQDAFLVDDGVDTGPILAQRAVQIADDDTADTLHERIKIIERELLADMVTALVAKGVVIEGRKARIP